MASCMICNNSVTVAANPAQDSTVLCAECGRLVAALSDDDHSAADARNLTILAIDLDD